MKMPTISRENFMLSCVEHEKSFITSGPYQSISWVQFSIAKDANVHADNEDIYTNADLSLR